MTRLILKIYASMKIKKEKCPTVFTLTRERVTLTNPFQSRFMTYETRQTEYKGTNVVSIWNFVTKPFTIRPLIKNNKLSNLIV